MKIAMDVLKNTPYNDYVCSVNIIKLMKGAGDMVQTIGTQPGMDSNPVMEMFKSLNNVPTQSCLVTGGKISDGQAALRIALPKQHLVEIVTAAMQIQQKMMMQTQPQSQP